MHPLNGLKHYTLTLGYGQKKFLARHEKWVMLKKEERLVDVSYDDDFYQTTLCCATVSVVLTDIQLTNCLDWPDLLSKTCAARTGVNFTNVFTSSFYACRSQKRKKDSQVMQLFALLGSLRVKAARKMLVKLIPGGPCYMPSFYMRFRPLYPITSPLLF